MIEHALSKVKKIYDRYKFTAYFLFLTVLLMMVSIIVKLDRGIQLDRMQLIVFMAALFGLLLSIFKRPHPILIVLVSFLSGGMVSFSVIGNLAQPFMAFLRASITYLYSYRQYLFTKVEILPDPSPMQENWNVLEQAVSVLSDRLGLWLSTLPDPAYDPVSINLIWGIVVWVISIWTYWFIVKKKQVLIGFLPPLIIITIVYRIVNAGIFTLLWVLGIGLLLEILANQAQQEEVWHQHKLSVSKLIQKRTTQYAIFLSLGLVIFAGTISSPKIDEFIEDLKERRRQAANVAPGGDGVIEVSSLDEDSLIGPEEVLGEISVGLLPNVHLIGSSPDLADVEVIHARIEDPIAPSSQSYYLRSATYDTYTLEGWKTNNKGYLYYPPEEEFEVDFTPNEKLVFQEVTILEDFQQGNLMYTVGELAATNVTYYASFHTKFVNNTYTDLFASVTEATEYLAYSIVPNFGEDELRNTSLDYPDWIANKYLQVPDSVPDRVYDLALSLTATQPTQYDRALAIEKYLREFDYTLELEDPPAYRDIVDYFLFELQEGYCDYFASSMVVLARAAGLPARLVTGYLASTYNDEQDLFIVTADQAHSWVEIYFAEYGWVTFEPTSGRPALERFEERETIPDEVVSDLETETPNQRWDGVRFPFLPNNLFVLIGQLIVIAIFGLLAAHWIDRLILQALEPDRMFARLYRRLRKMAQGLGVKIRDTDTPLEFSNLMDVFLIQLELSTLPTRILHSTPENSTMVIAACNQAAYEKNLPDNEQIRRVISAWGQLRWQLILVRIFIRLIPIRAEIRRVWTRLLRPA